MAKDRQIILRGYVYQEGDTFYGECIDLNLIVKRHSLDDALSALNEAVEGYVATVAENGLVDQLIPRKSPLVNRLRYHFRRLRHDLRVYWRQLVGADRVLTLEDGRASLA